MKIEELPYRQFEMLGIRKKDILELPPRTLNALLNGQRTSLMRFNNVMLPGMEHPVSLDAKLSIEVKADGTSTLKIHPINKTAKNTFNLTKEEIGFLEKEEDKFIERKIKGVDGTTKNVLITLDKTTNEYVAVNKASIKAPESINEVPLSESQKEDFKNGKAIYIKGEGYRLNPNSEIGISALDGNESKISRINFKHSTYSKQELVLDLTLLASGLGHYVLLEHLANIAMSTAADRIKENNKEKNLANPKYWEAINEASKEIKMLKDEQKHTPSIIGNIVNKYLEEIGVIYKADSQSKAHKTNNSSEENYTQNSGLAAEYAKKGIEVTASQLEGKPQLGSVRPEEIKEIAKSASIAENKGQKYAVIDNGSIDSRSARERVSYHPTLEDADKAARNRGGMVVKTIDLRDSIAGQRGGDVEISVHRKEEKERQKQQISM